MRGSHHPCAEFLGLYTPLCPIMRGSLHPCAEFPGLYTSAVP
ncbi:unnamed protein product, partial [Staurois parvus]